MWTAGCGLAISTVCPSDAVVVWEGPSSGSRHVVFVSHAMPFAGRTYAEAETQAVSYAERAHACVWSADGSRFRLVRSFVRV